MGAKSSRKGNAFERHIADLFTKLTGLKFYRVPRSGSIAGGRNAARFAGVDTSVTRVLAGDLIAPERFRFSVEVKDRLHTPSIDELLGGKSEIICSWLVQATAQAKLAGKNPMLVFRRTRGPILVAMPLPGLGHIAQLCSYCIHHTDRPWLILGWNAFAEAYTVTQANNRGLFWDDKPSDT